MKTIRGNPYPIQYGQYWKFPVWCGMLGLKVFDILLLACECSKSQILFVIKSNNVTVSFCKDVIYQTTTTSIFDKLKLKYVIFETKQEALDFGDHLRQKELLMVLAE